MSGEKLERLRQILLDQRDSVADILQRSQSLIDHPGEVFLDRVERLMGYRAGQMGQLKELDEERRNLVAMHGESDNSLKPIREDIRASLAVLATLDSRLRDLIFDAQLQAINNMASEPRFVNLRASPPQEHRDVSRVVNVTR